MQTFNGQLEVDNARGVIYFHSTDTEIPTLLRICQLQELPLIGSQLLDITVSYGWSCGGTSMRWAIDRNKVIMQNTRTIQELRATNAILGLIQNGVLQGLHSQEETIDKITDVRQRITNVVKSYGV